MRTRGRALDGLAHAQELADLVRTKRVARLDRRLAAHHVDDLVQRRLERDERSVLDGFRKEIAHERACVGVARVKKRRHGVDRDRARPERARAMGADPDDDDYLIKAVKNPETLQLFVAGGRGPITAVWSDRYWLLLGLAM